MNIWERKFQPKSRVGIEKTKQKKLKNFVYFKKVKKEPINFHVEGFQIRKIVG